VNNKTIQNNPQYFLISNEYDLARVHLIQCIAFKLETYRQMLVYFSAEIMTKKKWTNVLKKSDNNIMLLARVMSWKFLRILMPRLTIR
jgi:hypothetical protein